MPWLAAQPEGMVQRPAYLPFAALGAPRRLGQLNGLSRTVTRIDLSSRRILQSIPVGGAPTALSATPGAVWASVRVD